MASTCYSRRREQIRANKMEKQTDRSQTSLNGSPQRRNGHEKRYSDNEVPDNQCMDLFPSNLDQLHINGKSSLNRHLLSPKSPARKKPCTDFQTWSPISNERTTLSNKEYPELVSPVGRAISRKGETPDLSKSWSTIMDEEDERLRQKSSKRRLVMSDVSNVQESSVKPADKPGSIKPILTDVHRLKQRQKQLEYGKNTAAYGSYISLIPRYERSKLDPQTPDKFQLCSARSWTGQIKMWRKKLHFFDPPQPKTDSLFSASQSDTDTESTSSDTKADKMDVDSDNLSSTASSLTEEDMFKEFDLDSCLVDDGFPL